MDLKTCHRAKILTSFEITTYLLSFKLDTPKGNLIQSDVLNLMNSGNCAWFRFNLMKRFDKTYIISSELSLFIPIGL